MLKQSEIEEMIAATRASNYTVLVMPCPFCGGKDIEPWPAHYGDSEWNVGIVCMNCGAKVLGYADSTPTGATFAAAAAWNLRSQPEAAGYVSIAIADAAPLQTPAAPA